MDANTTARSALDEIERLLGVADRAMATVVALLTAIDPGDVIIDQGQTVRSWLRTGAGCTGGDERALLLASQRLTHLPTVRRWLADGTTTWAVVRSIVFATRRLTVAQLAWLDDTLAADTDRLARLDADGVIAAVDRLAADARPDLAADRQHRRFDRRYAQVQTGLDGSVQLYAEFDAEMGAAVLEALGTAPVAPEAPGGRDTDNASEPLAATDPSSQRSRGQRQADALHALCLQRRAADRNTGAAGCAPVPARPSMLVLTDVATLAGTGASPRVEHTAELLWRSSGGPVRLTAGAIDRIACHADIRPILTDGSLPLGVGAPTTNVGAPLRAALIARDGTCRFPSCRAPAHWCENHHIVPRHRDGATVLENLALLCTAHHHAVHEGGWRASLHTDGTMTFRRRGRQLTTVPYTDQRCIPTRPPPGHRPSRDRSAALVPEATDHSPRAEALPF